MTTGKNGKALNLGKQYMKIRENYKTHCCQARNTEQKEEDTAKHKVGNPMLERSLIFSLFNEACKEVSNWSDEKVKLEFDKGKISFRAYYPNTKINITLCIEDYEEEK